MGGILTFDYIHVVVTEREKIGHISKELIIDKKKINIIDKTRNRQEYTQSKIAEIHEKSYLIQIKCEVSNFCLIISGKHSINIY